MLSMIAAGVLLVGGNLLRAQSSLDALQQELNAAKQAHQDVTAQTLTNFFAQIDPAMASPDTAVALYQQAGGAMPDPSPVITENENETPTEKATRLALDQATNSRVGAILQLQCGLMHFGALFVVKPNQTGLQDQWVAWLKTAAVEYPQAMTVPAPAAPSTDPHKKKRNGDDKAGSGFSSADLKGKAIKDSAISKFLAFNVWGDKEQGGWAVKDLPKLYRANVLDPLRATPTADTLAAWDAYIGMANADEKDNDRWNQVVYPPLQFDRACDDYAITPGTDKLEALVNLLKANPTNPYADEWIAKVGQLMDDYRAKHGGAPVAQTPATNAAPSGNPAVSVTTQQQGDATIITTHNNSAPVAPAH
jgi:hypothetical protein